MRKLIFISASLLAVLWGNLVKAQDFSNKGKEFWLAYCYHVGMVGGASPTMTLYITSDVNTSYVVEAFGAPSLTIQSGNITAGQVVSVIIPANYFINDEGLFNNKAIRVTAAKPVVVYSYITRTQASSATLCLPVNVLGKEYYSMNFTQVSNENSANSYFTIIAIEDNTAVEITPAGNTKNGWMAGSTNTINLNKGDIYQVLGVTNGVNGDDLTGSKIKSVATATGGCKKIAVFSGSGKIRIPATGCNSSSSDNLYQQLYPVVSWGKKYLTAPSVDKPTNYYRIGKSDPATNVYLNGVLIPAASFTGGFYYQFSNNTPNLIEADNPVSVTQYFTTQECDGNRSPYDPDMIVLNPVEQNIDRVTLVSSNLYATETNFRHQHNLHIIMRNGGTGISTFKLDNTLVPAALWTVHPYDAGYSYLYLRNVGQGYHTLASDSGFNAVAYGYGDAESYGYSAGANVKDLYQYVSVSNQYATVDFPAACRNSPFSFSMTFPYQPTQITWQFNGLFPDVTINAPVYDQTAVVNGRTIYKYNLAGTFTAPVSGAYPIKVIAQNPTADGCGGVQEIDYELQVFDPPVADFNFATTGCVNSVVNFTDKATNTSGRTITHSYWDFGDGSIVNDQATIAHTYAAANSYDVKHTIITDVGCKADTLLKTVVLNDPPVASFTTIAPYCTGKTISFTDASTFTGSTVIAKWIWNFGDGSPAVTATTNAVQSHSYTTPGTYQVTLQLETITGCVSNVYTGAIIVSPNPVVDFSLPQVCLPAGAAQFNSLSTISDGTQNLFNYVWDFGDATPTTGGQNPLHNYTATGPYNVMLTVTSGNGCISTLTKALTTIYPEPQAAFTAPPEVCFGTAINFTDQSTAAGSTVAQWQWSFGDGTSSVEKLPVKTYALPGTYTVTLNVVSSAGCSTITKQAVHTIVVNQLPQAGFNLSVPACAGKDVAFTNTSVANDGIITKWTWNFGDGTTSSLTNGNSVTHNYATANTYTVTLQVETDKGCVSTVFSRTIVIHPVPVVSFTVPEICVSDLAVFTDGSSVATGSISSWQWNFGDGNATGANPNTAIIQSPSHQYNLPGNYTAGLTVTSNEGCTNMIQKSFVVNGAALTPRFTLQNPAALCSNTAVSIKDASQVNAGSIIRVEIFWDAADLTNKTIDTDPVTGKVYTHKYPEFGTPATKTYTIRYDVYSGIVCVNSFSQQITLLAAPVLSFNTIDPVCSNVGAFQLTQAVLQNGLPGTGIYTGSGVSANGIFNPAVANEGTHLLAYTYTAANTCTNTITQSVVVYPTPVADAGPDKVVLEGGVVLLTPALITRFPVSYLWTPADGLTNAAIASPGASPTADITYTLTVSSEKGCKTSDDVFVKLLQKPVIPNIFSPNGDGIHDKWVIEYLESYPGCEVQIFNRYGQAIYKIVNYTTPWDGKINGKDAPIGTYYYIIDPKNGRKPMTGFVDIIR